MAQLGNQWHWEEKNTTLWSTGKLRDLFSDIKLQDDTASVAVTEVSKLTGESSVNLRKGKKIYVYEFQAKLKWRGRLAGEEKESEGTASLSEISSDEETPEITISSDNENLKSQVQANLKRALRQAVEQFVRDYKEAF
eukprot:TRINITY_DN534_c0_g1_i1.p1 TRINITY_DN534_c0_g1~~TRINITY_DN534_c0_g1_i1.p1  ORF type:complete len:138 (+),score=24.55 TRINITY_DN534_c0_g1_i1:97-510(+)